MRKSSFSRSSLTPAFPLVAHHLPTLAAAAGLAPKSGGAHGIHTHWSTASSGRQSPQNLAGVFCFVIAAAAGLSFMKLGCMMGFRAFTLSQRTDVQSSFRMPPVSLESGPQKAYVHETSSCKQKAIVGNVREHV